MYTTLSPCDMCTGACILYKVKRVVLGENNTFVGGEDYLKARGVEVINVKSPECEALMTKFIKEKPGDWYMTLFIIRKAITHQPTIRNEDIGEPSA